jgi:hypothetical protein
VRGTVFAVASDPFKELAAVDVAAAAQSYIAHSWGLERSTLYPGALRDLISSKCLASSMEAQNFRDRMRLDLSVLPGPEAIRRKQLLSADEMNQKIFQTAFVVAYQQGMNETVWDWI